MEVSSHEGQMQETCSYDFELLNRIRPESEMNVAANVNIFL